MSLRNILRSSIKNGMSARANLAAYQSERIRKWTTTLNSKAESPEAKTYCSQLSSLIQFYSKRAKETMPEIDWNHWKNEIQTKDLVDNLRLKYDDLIKEEYDIERACTAVVSSNSPELEELSKELSFHGSIWLNAYSDYNMFLFELEEYGNPNEYLMHENYDFFKGLEPDLEELTETHNYFPGSKDDINLRGYYAVQFAWGKKVISFFRHPADDFKCGKATKNILGR